MQTDVILHADPLTVSGMKDLPYVQKYWWNKLSFIMHDTQCDKYAVYRYTRSRLLALRPSLFKK